MANKWTAANVEQVILDQFLAIELGWPRIVPDEQMQAVRQKIIAESGKDPVQVARRRASRINRGIEKMPQIFGYEDRNDSID